MRWPRDLSHLDEFAVGVRPRGVYIPNYATMMLGGSYGGRTDGGFTPPVGFAHLPCEPGGCIPMKIRRITGRAEMEEVLERAKRAILTLDLAIPVEALGQRVPFFEYVSAQTGKDVSRLPENPVHQNEHRVRFPPSIRAQVLEDNWADQELYEFTRSVYEKTIQTFGEDGAYPAA